MRKTLLASMLTAGLVLPALAEDAGTIKLHSGWKLIQERVDKGVAYGTLWGITFNDTGSGPLHVAPASGTYNLTQQTNKGEGELTWGDGDDQLKGSFTITVTDGKATGENIVTGTGKLAGITGGPFACAFVGKPEDQQAWVRRCLIGSRPHDLLVILRQAVSHRPPLAPVQRLPPENGARLTIPPTLVVLADEAIESQATSVVGTYWTSQPDSEMSAAGGRVEVVIASPDFRV